MSVRASHWTWEFSQARGSAFLVLLCLADHAGQDGGDAYPSVERLAKRCRVDERTVQRALATLRELGEIEVQEPSTSRKATRYRLPMRGDNLSPLPGVTGGNLSAGGDISSLEGGQDAALTKRDPLGTAPTDSAAPSSALCEECGGTGWADTGNGQGVVRCEHDGRWLRSASLRVVKDSA